MTHRLFTPWDLALAFFLCVANAAGIIDTFDATPSVEAARNFWLRGSLSIPLLEPNWWFYWQGRGYEWYSKMGPVFTALYLGPVGLGLVLGEAVGHTEHWIRFFVSLINPLLTFALFVVVRGHYLGEGRRKANLLGLLAIAGTFVWVYAKSCHREPFQALCLVAAFVAWSRGTPLTFSAGLRGGLWLGLGVAAKTAFAPLLFPPLLWGATESRRQGQFQTWAKGTALSLGSVALVLGLYQTYLWGSPLRLGYSAEVTDFQTSVWSTSLAHGLWQQWLAPRSGLLFYSPLLLLFPWAATRKGRWSGWDWAVLTAIVVQTVLYARWFSPVGHESWGPRYLVVVTPLFFLLWKDVSLRLSPALFAFIAGCVLLQGVYASVKPQQYYTLAQRGEAELGYGWRVHLQLFAKKFPPEQKVFSLGELGGPTGRSVDLGDSETLTGLNYWWAHMFRFVQSAKGAEPAAPEAKSIKKMSEGRQDTHSGHTPAT